MLIKTGQKALSSAQMRFLFLRPRLESKLNFSSFCDLETRTAGRTAGQEAFLFQIEAELSG